MVIYLGILLFSFILTSIALVPFIDFLYRLHFTSSSPHKSSIPVGGGVLLISLITGLYAILLPLLSRFGVYITAGYPLKDELNILFFSLISFGLVGLYDDIVKIFQLRSARTSAFSLANKLVLQTVLSIILGLLLYQNLAISIVHIPFIGVIELGIFYVPLAAFIIFTFSRSFDITDGMDGLASGILLIALMAFWAISVTTLDTTLSVFIALWIGSLIAFLYFNVYPARIWLGNAGSLSFGATLAVAGLLLGKGLALMLIGGIIVLEGLTHLLYLLFRKRLSKKFFPASPFHYLLQSQGWPEPKVVFRFWLGGVVLALIGLWLAGV